MADVKKGLRTVRNVVHNYNDAQVKVREATSNDPWGPAASLMSEIADMTFNHIAFSDIMQMLWKRMNDSGAKWRHVYKALVVLDYIIKAGSEKVAQHCKENMYFIQTLQNFQHVEEMKDHGLNVREKAKQVVALLTDEERLKNERVKAQKTRERFQYSGAGPLYRGDSMSGGFGDGPSSNFSPGKPELENIRPQSENEEEIQLQIALALSKEEAAEEERRRQRDDVRLQMALNESQQDFEKHKSKPVSSADELFDIFQAPDTKPSSSRDPWDAPTWSDGRAPTSAPQSLATDPWSTPAPAPARTSNSSLLGSMPPAAATLDPWSQLTPISSSNSASNSPNTSSDQLRKPGSAPRNPTEDFLGTNSKLVNLDSLITLPPRPNPTTSLLSNPFGTAPAMQPPINPFHQAAPAPTINQLRGSPNNLTGAFSSPPPMMPAPVLQPNTMGMYGAPPQPAQGAFGRPAAGFPQTNQDGNYNPFL